MKITIDTNEDKPEDIRKVVAFLSSISDKNFSQQGTSRNIFEDSSSSLPSTGESPSEPQEEPQGSGLMSMFGSAPTEPQTASEETDESNEEEEKEESVELMTY